MRVYLYFSLLILTWIMFKNLDFKGFNFTSIKKLIIFFVFLLILEYSMANFSDLAYVQKVVLIIPSLFIISFTDIVQGYIYDEDLLFIAIFLFDFNIGSLISCFLVFLTLYLISVLSKGLGMGDVLFFTTLSLFGNLYNISIIFFLSFIFAGVYAIPKFFIFSKEDKLIPFGPFICMSFIFVNEILPNSYLI